MEVDRWYSINTTAIKIGNSVDTKDIGKVTLQGATFVVVRSNPSSSVRLLRSGRRSEMPGAVGSMSAGFWQNYVVGTPMQRCLPMKLESESIECVDWRVS